MRELGVSQAAGGCSLLYMAVTAVLPGRVCKGGDRRWHFIKYPSITQGRAVLCSAPEVRL